MNAKARFGWPTRAALALLAVVALAVAWLEYRDAQLGWQRARDDLSQCRTLARRIKSLQTEPTFAAVQADSATDIAEHIEAAVKSSALPTDSLVRIQPQSSQRLGNSPYRVFPTRLEVKQVTLSQLVHFARELSDARHGLVVRDLRIWDNSRGVAGQDELWWAEIALTQLTFSPKTR